MSDPEALVAAFITIPIVSGALVGMASGAVILCGIAVCCAPFLCLALAIVGPVVLASLAISYGLQFLWTRPMVACFLLGTILGWGFTRVLFYAGTQKED